MAFCDFAAGCQSTEEVFVLAGCLLDVNKNIINIIKIYIFDLRYIKMHKNTCKNRRKT